MSGTIEGYRAIRTHSDLPLEALADRFSPSPEYRDFGEFTECAGAADVDTGEIAYVDTENEYRLQIF